MSEFSQEFKEKAVDIMEKDGKSISNLQRKLDIGYTKAIRLVHEIETDFDFARKNLESDGV